MTGGIKKKTKQKETHILFNKQFEANFTLSFLPSFLPRKDTYVLNNTDTDTRQTHKNSTASAAVHLTFSSPTNSLQVSCGELLCSKSPTSAPNT